MEQSKTLRLPLKTKWFMLTKSGVKTEDYREINEYWFKRLVFNHKKAFKYTAGYDWDLIDDQSRAIFISAILKDELKKSMIAFKPFEKTAVTLGYPKNDDDRRVLRLQHKGIEVRAGNPDWGAKAGELYFVIKHGAILNN